MMDQPQKQQPTKKQGYTMLFMLFYRFLPCGRRLKTVLLNKWERLSIG
jgi:hypothetical protein